MGLRNLFGGTDRNAFKGADSFCEYLQQTGLYDFENEVIKNFDSLADELHDWLVEKDFKQSEHLFNLVMRLKEGQTRKDNVTPSALHEVTQAIWLISLVEDGLPIEDVEGVMSVILAHDIGEEYNYTPEDMEQYLRDCGQPASAKLEQFKEDFDLISKTYGEDGVKRHANNAEYYYGIQTSANATVAKMLDRAHNIMTLINVKDIPSMHSYIASTELITSHLMDIHDQNKKAGTPHPQHDTYAALTRVLKKEMKTSRYFTAKDSGFVLPGDDELLTGMPKKGMNHLPTGLHPLFVPAERLRQSNDFHLQENPVRYSQDKTSKDFYGDNDRDIGNAM